MSNKRAKANDPTTKDELKECVKDEDADEGKKARFALDITTLDACATDLGTLESFITQLRNEINTAAHGSKRDGLLLLLGRATGRHEVLVKDAELSAKMTVDQHMVDVDFKIGSQPMLHRFDFDRFIDYVFNLFTWFTVADVMVKYMAPYFLLVQSSGMGKTKLLWELSNLIRGTITTTDSEQDDFIKDCMCQLILCTVGKPREKIGENHVFPTILDVPKSDTTNDSDNICSQLNNILTELLQKKKTSKGHVAKVILLFDESQHLLLNDGFAFGSIRWWLRQKRASCHIVAVFSGTTLRLANVAEHPPQWLSTTSRQVGTHVEYYKSGSSLYEPFWNISTIGLFAHQRLTVKSSDDYERAVPYGRPLFAVMQDDDKLRVAAECNILGKLMLHRESEWIDNGLNVCLSILGTRLQMGQPTSFKVATDLIEKGYAVLSHFDAAENSDDTGRAYIFYPTDPACARLAMALMDETWTAPKENTTLVCGKAKRFWTRKMSKLVTTGFCSLSQGGFGNIAAAAYLLFCGDVLRKIIDKEYRTFSVPLTAFVKCLLEPTACYEQNVQVTGNPTSEDCLYTDARVNFIQVTRNYLRFSLEDLLDQGFLRDIYHSGCAFYTHPLFPLFDLFTSVKLSNQKDEESIYVPLLVSVSTEMTIVSPKDWLQSVQSELEEKVTTGAMSLRLLFGLSDPDHMDTCDILSQDDVGRLLNGEVVSKVVIVPKDDPFGITDMLADVTLFRTEKSEAYSSHCFLFTHTMEQIDTKTLVRLNHAPETVCYLNDMRKALLGSKQN